MRRLGVKKWRPASCLGLLMAAMILYIVVTSFIFAADIGYLAEGALDYVDIPGDEIYVQAFATGSMDWELAYWCAMMCEYTYGKPAYPPDNLALSKLGFTTVRGCSLYGYNGGSEDDLLVDVGVKEIDGGDGGGFTLVAIAFRGTVPSELRDPTTVENMWRNIQYSAKPWKGTRALAHKGFLDQYGDFAAKVLPGINAALGLTILQGEGASGQQIKYLVTGHSMGGALAELMALDLIEHGAVPEDVLAFGFATPHVGGKSLREYAGSIGAADRIYRIAHKQDLIGMVGYKVWFGESLAAKNNTVRFGSGGMFDRSHHGLPRIYLPLIVEKNSQLRQQQLAGSLVSRDIRRIGKDAVPR